MAVVVGDRKIGRCVVNGVCFSLCVQSRHPTLRPGSESRHGLVAHARTSARSSGAFFGGDSDDCTVSSPTL